MDRTSLEERFPTACDLSQGALIGGAPGIVKPGAAAAQRHSLACGTWTRLPASRDSDGWPLGRLRVPKVR